MIAAGKALADIIVGVAEHFELQALAQRTRRAIGPPSRAGARSGDPAAARSCRICARCALTCACRSRGGCCAPCRSAASSRRLEKTARHRLRSGRRARRAPRCALGSCRCAARRRHRWTSSGLRSRSSRCSAPRLTCASKSVRPIISSKRARAEAGEDLAHFLGDEGDQVDDLLGSPVNLARSALVLRADADRAGVGMALAHHDAAHRNQRSGADAVFLGAQASRR